jgi:hypothetical protein
LDVTRYYLDSDLIEINAWITHNYQSTGTIRLVLWDVQEYKGGAEWRGYIIAKVELMALSRRQNFHHVIETTHRAHPIVENFTKILALEAYEGGEFVMKDYRTIDRNQCIYRHTQFEGSVDFNIKGRFVEIRAERINLSTKSPLLMVLWACEQPAADDLWSGHKVTEVTVDPSGEDLYKEDVVRRGKCSRPHPGAYYMIIELKSRDDSQWVREGYVQLQDMTSF